MAASGSNANSRRTPAVLRERGVLAQSCGGGGEISRCHAAHCRECVRGDGVAKVLVVKPRKLTDRSIIRKRTIQRCTHDIDHGRAG
jgi:hypothetical protein